jgi:hypothetical protein
MLFFPSSAYANMMMDFYSETLTYISGSVLIVTLIKNLLIESLVGLTFLHFAKLPKKTVFSVWLANVISVPIVWLIIFPLLVILPITLFQIRGQDHPQAILFLTFVLLAEVFAVLFESFLIHRLNRNSLSFKKSFYLSLTNNISSFLAPFSFGFVLLTATISFII